MLIFCSFFSIYLVYLACSILPILYKFYYNVLEVNIIYTRGPQSQCCRLVQSYTERIKTFFTILLTIRVLFSVFCYAHDQHQIYLSVEKLSCMTPIHGTKSLGLLIYSKINQYFFFFFLILLFFCYKKQILLWSMWWDGYYRQKLCNLFTLQK